LGVYQRILRTIFVIAIPVLAAAQQNQNLRDRDPELEGAKTVTGELQEANFHYGAFYLLSRFRIADAGYSAGGYVPTGSEGGLSLSVEAPHRIYYVPHKKTIFTASLTPSYSFFAQDGQQTQFNYLARGDAHLLFNHLYLDAYGQVADQLRAHTADFNRMATVKEKELGVLGEIKYSSRTSALFSVNHRDINYPEDRYQPERRNRDTDIPTFLLDRTERNGRVALHHKTFPKTSLFVAAEASDYAFDFTTYKDSRRLYYGAGFKFDNGRSSLTMEAGPLSLDFDGSDASDYDGYMARIEASRGNGRWNLHGGAHRDLGFSIFANNSFYVATSANVGLEHASTRRLTLRTGVVWERDEYETPVLGETRRDEYSFSSVGFSYGLKQLRAGLDVGWYQRESTAFGEEESGIRYVLHLSYTP
jgi:hypothetical protein